MTKVLLGLVLLAAMAIPAVASAGQATSGVKFLTPKPGATTKSKVTFTVKLRNFKLDAKDVGKMKKANMGLVVMLANNDHSLAGPKAPVTFTVR